MVMFPLFSFPVDMSVPPRILDGDSIMVSLDRGWSDTKFANLRLYGINAPETRTKKKCEKEAGLLVKEVVEVWYNYYWENGYDFVVTSLEKGKYYGRFIGEFFAVKDDRMFSLVAFLLYYDLVDHYDGGKRASFSAERCKAIIDAATMVLNERENLVQFSN